MPKDIPHFVLTASNDGIPTADIRKFVEYTLNDEHPKGKDKARAEDSEFLLEPNDLVFVPERII